jgi:DNA gyrase/topoisomerase IV subunit A
VFSPSFWFVKGVIRLNSNCMVSYNFRILEAYQTGRGRVVIRGKTEIETDERTKRQAIIIKEVLF